MERAAAQIADSNPVAAEAFLRAALTAAARIAFRPNLGSIRPYIPRRYRFWPLTRYSVPASLRYDDETGPNSTRDPHEA